MIGYLARVLTQVIEAGELMKAPLQPRPTLGHVLNDDTLRPRRPPWLRSSLSARALPFRHMCGRPSSAALFAVTSAGAGSERFSPAPRIYGWIGASVCRRRDRRRDQPGDETSNGEIDPPMFVDPNFSRAAHNLIAAHGENAAKVARRNGAAMEIVGLKEAASHWHRVADVIEQREPSAGRIV
jgi:hypothetical protein